MGALLRFDEATIVLGSGVTLAGPTLKLPTIEDFDFSTGVIDQAIGLQGAPYVPGAGGQLAVSVYEHGRLLPGATVMLNNLQFDSRPTQTVVTDAGGRAVFTFPRVGDWQLNVIWTRPLTDHFKADFDTTFSSPTFGFPAGSGRASAP